MNGVKGLVASKTFWGAALAVVGSIAGLLGYGFSPEEQKAVIEIGTTLATAFGGLFAIYGRVKATKKIG